MIKELNADQISQLSVYAERYIKLGLSTKPFTSETKESIISIIHKIYEDANLAPPTTIEFFSSPNAALKVAAKARGTTSKDELSNLCYGSQEAGWIAYYKYFQEVVGIDLKSRLSMGDLCGLCSFWLPYDTHVFVSQNLSEIHMENNILHNAKGPSWSYADGICGYTLFGVAVTEEIVMDMLPDKKNGGKRILGIENAEQRLVAIKAYGAENMLEQLKAKVVDTKKGTVRDGDSRAEYVLFSVNIEGTDEKLLEMANPSEPKRHYEWVTPECTTVNEALAWRCGMNVFVEPVTKS